jgi:outer membrane protein TolC
MIASRVVPLLWLVAGTAAAAILDLPLSDAVERALDSNLSLLAAQYASDASEYSVLASRSEFDLKVVPTTVLGRIDDSSTSSGASDLNASVGAQFRKRLAWGTTLSVGPSYNRFGDASNTTFNVGVHQPFFSGFGREAALDGVRTAEHDLASSQRSYRRARRQLALDTVEVYYTALREKYVAEMSGELAERLRRQVAVAGLKEKAGLAGPSDTFRAQIRLKDAETSAYQAQGTFDLATGRLLHLLSLPPDTDLQLHPAVPPDIGIEDAEQRAIDDNYELQQLRDDLAEAERTARVAANAALPDVSLNASYGQAALADPLLQSFIPATQRVWSIYLQSSGDLNRTAEKMKLQRALLRVNTVKVEMEDKTDDVRREIRQQLHVIDNARARIGLRDEQIRQAEGKRALAEVKFAHDMADNFELIEAESDLYRARIERSTAETEYATAAYTLRSMMGQFP